MKSTHPAIDGALRHPGEARRSLLLRKRDAARLLDERKPRVPSEPVPERTTPMA